MNFTHSLGYNIMNDIVGRIGIELSTYLCMRNIHIFLNVVNIYIIIKTCTKHGIGLEILDQSPNLEKISY